MLLFIFVYRNATFYVYIKKKNTVYIGNFSSQQNILNILLLEDNLVDKMRKLLLNKIGNI